MATPLLPRLWLIAAAFLFSTGGAAIKLTTWGTWQVAGLRSGLAALFLVVALPGGRTRWSRRGLLVGCAFAATMLLFVASNQRTTAANAVFLQATSPLYVLIVAPWLLGERWQRRDLVTLVLVGGALVALVGASAPEQGSAPDPATGNLLGAVSGLTWALTVVGMRWMWLAREPVLSAVVAGNAITALVALPLALPLQAGGPSDLAAVAWLGVFQIGLAYACLGQGVRRVPAVEASLLLLFEPLLNPLWTWLLHGERSGAGAFVGGALILTAALARARARADARQ